MAGKANKNELGLLARDYLHRFAAWNVPKQELVVLHSWNVSFAKCEEVLRQRHGDECEPRRRRRLHLKKVQEMKTRHDEQWALRMLGRRTVTAEAKAYLLQFVGEANRAALADPGRPVTQGDLVYRGKIAFLA